ncbi:MAG: hypothetical protein LW712_04190 [Burkholderiaceae bacterium]|nr:hypothetical protein [Burkholderiaceae bacterium]
MKHTPEKLQKMARVALTARDAGDPKWLQLVFGLAVRGPWTPREIEQGIERLARGEVPA